MHGFVTHLQNGSRSQEESLSESDSSSRNHKANRKAIRKSRAARKWNKGVYHYDTLLFANIGLKHILSKQYFHPLIMNASTSI